MPRPPDDMVLLRPLRRDDWRVTHAWRNDPEIRDNILGHRFPVTTEMEEAWVSGVLRDQGIHRSVHAIELRTDGAFVGLAYLQGIDWVHHTAECGILVGDRSRHGHGIGTSALTLLLAYASDSLNLRKLTARVAAYNEPSLRLFTRCRFEREGLLRQQIWLNGRYHDLVLFGRMLDGPPSPGA